jgi:hypothetical protein
MTQIFFDLRATQKKTWMDGLMDGLTDKGKSKWSF